MIGTGEVRLYKPAAPSLVNHLPDVPQGGSIRKPKVPEPLSSDQMFA